MASYYSHHPATTATLLLGLFSAICGAVTTTNSVQFLFPTNGTTLHYNDYVQVQYISEFSDPWLVAFCSSADGHIDKKGSQSVGGYNNTATVKLGWSGSDTPCWFDLKPNSTAPVGSGANSDQWSYDVSQRAATTVGLAATSTPTPGAISMDTGAANATNATSTPYTSTSSSDGSGSLSTGAQAGIGVGAAVAGICIGAAAVFVFMRWRRRRTARTAAAARVQEDQSGREVYLGDDEVKHPGGYQYVQQEASSVSEVDAGYPAAQELEGAPGLYELSAYTDSDRK